MNTPSTISRRALAKGSAWATPVILAAAITLVSVAPKIPVHLKLHVPHHANRYCMDTTRSL